ncbi:MAG: TonB-dependent receptor [Paludibacteraceae bacterium]
MKGKHVTFIVLFFLSVSTLWAQTIKVQGVVTDKKTGETLIGANVLEKGTTNGIITNFDGNFVITVPTGATLVISYVGYEPREVVATSAGPIAVALSTNDKVLDEVVVVGYGSQKVKDMTAPVAVVKGEDLVKQITANPMSALQGKVSGVQIINSGASGAGPSVKIRGVGSIGDYGNPLYIVDGVFVDNIDFLSSSDIETMNVLKDASAAAIYGVRAANGVVLITTKTGGQGRANISYDGYFSVQNPTNVMKLANTEQCVQMQNEAYANTNGYVPKVAANYPGSTDWYSQLLRNATMQSHAIDISGGTDKTSYSVGANYFYQEGIMDAKNDYNRYNLRARLDQVVNAWLKVGSNSVLSNYNKNNANNNAFFQAFVNPPVYNIYNENNTAAYPVHFDAPQLYGFGNSYANPVAVAYYNNNSEKGLKLISSTFAELSFFNNRLKIKSSYNLDYASWQTRDYVPEFFVGSSQGLTNSRLTKTFIVSSKQIFDNILTYTDKVGLHSFSAMLGQSARIEKLSGLSATALNVPDFDEQSMYLGLGSSQNITINDTKDAVNPYQNNGVSAFVRGTYNYADRYLGTFTFRADGSSKYQEKWGYFPSVGLGWILTGEDFMSKQQLFNFLKFRASWGLLGNDNVPANSALTLGSTGVSSSGVFGDKLVDGVGSQTVIQNYLKWEVVNEANAGFDFTLLGQRLSGELDYYNRTTYNVVFYAPIATGGGTAELLSNNGTVHNQGIELGLNWNDKINDNLTYRIGFNATTINNKVLALNGRSTPIPGASIRGNYATQTKVGYPIGSFWGYEVEGVYASEAEALKDPVSQTIKDAGYFKYKNQNDDLVIDENDKVYLGSAIPWLIGGIDLGLDYKNWDLGLTLQGQLGNKVLNAKRMNRDVFPDGNYDLDFYENRWTKDNKSNTYPSAEAYTSSFTQQPNDFFIEDASYIRIQNVQLGYTLKTLPFVKSLRVYLSAQRPFTFFTYKGFTPEVSGSPISAGVDTNVYPMQAVYTLGAKVNF